MSPEMKAVLWAYFKYGTLFVSLPVIILIFAGVMLRISLVEIMFFLLICSVWIFFARKQSQKRVAFEEKCERVKQERIQARKEREQREAQELLESIREKEKQAEMFELQVRRQIQKMGNANSFKQQESDYLKSKREFKMRMK